MPLQHHQNSISTQDVNKYDTTRFDRQSSIGMIQKYLIIQLSSSCGMLNGRQLELVFRQYKFKYAPRIENGVRKYKGMLFLKKNDLTS